MKKLILGLLALGFTTQFMFSQEIELPEVYLDVNYQYLDAIASEDVAESVKLLEKEVAFFDLKGSELYDDDFEIYNVTFFIPEGKILATYDEEGKIVSTIERFDNVRLPVSVSNAIMSKYPNWEVVADTYKVNYYGKSAIAKKQYKVKLENETKNMIVKLDPDGDFR